MTITCAQHCLGPQNYSWVKVCIVSKISFQSPLLTVKFHLLNYIHYTATFRNFFLRIISKIITETVHIESKEIELESRLGCSIKTDIKALSLYQPNVAQSLYVAYFSM